MGVRGRRTAALLNWRYRTDPLHPFRVIPTRRQGELIAFAIVCATSEIVTIVDIFGTQIQESAILLLAAIVESFKGSQQTVEGDFAPGGDLIGNLLNKGFAVRSKTAQDACMQ